MRKSKNRGILRDLLKRGTALALSVAMGALGPMQSLAAVGATKQNTQEENQNILDVLNAITGDTETTMEVYEQLRALNLTDEDGNLITRKMQVDGKEMTVQEVLAMIEGGADLSKTVTVDGTTLTLGNLQTMAKIEAELARIQETYFNENVELTDEQREALDSLRKQLSEDGITIDGFASLEDEVKFASGINHDAYLTVSSDQDKDGEQNLVYVQNEEGTVTFHVKLSEPQGQDVYFSARTMDGSAKGGVNFTPLEETEYKIPAGETEFTIPIEIKKETIGWGKDQGAWRGTHVFFLQLNQPKGTGFRESADGEDQSAILYRIQIKSEELNVPEGSLEWARPSGSEWKPEETIQHSISKKDWEWIDQVKDHGFLVFEKDVAPWNSSWYYIEKFGTPTRFFYTGDSSVLLDGKELFPRTTQLGFDIGKLRTELEKNRFYPGKNAIEGLKGYAPEAVFRDPEFFQRMRENGIKESDSRKSRERAIRDYANLKDLDAGIYQKLKENQTITVSATVANYNAPLGSSSLMGLLTDYVFELGIRPIDPKLKQTFSGSYHVGDYFPVELKLNQPARLKLSTEYFTVQEARSSISDEYTLIGQIGEEELYTPKSDNERLQSEGIAGSDYWKYFSSITKDDDTMVGKNRFDQYATIKSEVSDDWEIKTTLDDVLSHGGVSMPIFEEAILPGQKSLRVVAPIADGAYSYLASSGTAQDAEGNYYSTRLSISNDGEHFFPLYFADADGNYTNDQAAALMAEIPLTPNVSTKDVTKAVELYYMGEDGKPKYVVTDQYSTYTQKPAILLTANDLEILYPQDYPEYTGLEKEIVYADEEGIESRLKLDWQIKEESAGKDFTWRDDHAWSTADGQSAKVAAIDEKTGQVTLTGAGGVAKFRLTATNGGTSASGEAAEGYWIETKPIRIGVGYTPFLTIDEKVGTVSIRAGEPAIVKWSTNLFDKVGEAKHNPNAETEITFTIYEAKYDENGTLLPVTEEDKVLEETVIGTQNKPVFEQSFEGLERIVEKGRHSYVVVARAEVDQAIAPGNWEPVEATAYIDVQARPAQIAISRPSQGTTITDQGTSLVLNWNTQYVDSVNGAQVAVTVTDNDTKEAVLNVIDTVKSDIENGQGSFAITVPDGGFKRTFTVEAKIKNEQDTGWSTDSYVLSVYDDDSLKILVDGEEIAEGDEILLSNREAISKMTQDDILALNREIRLQKSISINSKEYAWKDLADRMEWALEQTSKVSSINYLYGSQYRDIEKLNFETYAPLDEFLFSGLLDGEAKLTVRHQFASGLEARANVTVETLKDRLYLFQFYPAQKTQVTYTNGEGVTTTIDSDETGRAAIYEESGIHGDIYLKSGEKNDVYVGTIFEETLVSSENDAATLELYPLNTLQLRRVAQVPVSFKKPDGTPYQGKMTVHGGAVVNGKYEEEVLIDGKDGKKGFSVDLGTSGAHTFQFDLTQFASELSSLSNIEFLFELQFEDDAYQPMFLNIDGSLNELNTIKTAERVNNLIAHDKKDKKEPVTVVRRFYYNGEAEGGFTNLLGVKGRFGPSTTVPAVTLETLAMWWGNKPSAEDADKQLVYTDSYGVKMPAQKFEVVEYPFLTMPVIRNTMVLDEAAMKELKLGVANSMTMELEYRDNEKQVARRESSGLRLTNFIGMDEASDSDRLTMVLSEMRKAGSQNTNTKFKNSMIGLGLNLATKVGIESDYMTLKLTPTSDPTYFKGFVMLGVNKIEKNEVEVVNDYGTQKGDLNYKPGFSEVKGVFQNGLANELKEAKTLTKYAASMLKDQGKRGIQNGFASNGALKEGSPSYALQGYFETEVYYDYDNNCWEMAVLNGGFTVGGGYGMDWKWNASVGPVPVLAELGLGASLLVDFQVATDRQVHANDYMTELRLMAYFKAFAGLGFDYAVIALKIGLYGQINLDGRINFLNAKGSPVKVGYYLGGDGEVGIKFAIKILFIKYSKVLVGVKGEIGSINNKTYQTNEEYWKKVKNGRSGQEYPMIPASEEEVTTVTTRQAARARLVAHSDELDMNIYEIPIDGRLEERDYLDTFERAWISEDVQEAQLAAKEREAEKQEAGAFARVKRFFGLAPAVETEDETVEIEGENVASVWTNAYPEANPVVSDDGYFMAYLTDQGESDVTKTRVAVRTAESTGDGEVLDAGGFGDSYLKMAGSKKDATAVWSRVTMNIKKDPGAVVTDSEQSQMMTSTEIMAARWNENEEKWELQTLTDNAMADLSPAIATNGTKAVVMWRRVAGTDSSNVTNFNARDEIIYRVYDAARGGWTDEKAWGPERILYNGTSGAVAGLEAAMLPDGTAAAVYTVDTGSEEKRAGGDTSSAQVDETTGDVTSDMEVFYSVINRDAFDEDDANTVTTVRYTTDEYLDENPQIAAVSLASADEQARSRKALFGAADRTFGETLDVMNEQIEQAKDDGRFVIGWHSIQKFNGVQQEDIRLAAFDRNGVLESRFPAAVSTIANNSGANISANFRFSKGADRIEELSILWDEPAMEVEETTAESAQDEGEEQGLTTKEYDVMRAMHFTLDEGVYKMTAAQVLAKMGTGTTIEHFDAFVDNGEVNAYILGSRYDGETFEEIPVDYGEESSEETVLVAAAESRIYRASAGYSDKLEIDYAVADYNVIYKKSDIPVQIGVTNMGTTPVESVTVHLADEEKTLDADSGFTPLEPGESRVLTVMYRTDGTIADVDYSVDAKFAESKNVVTTKAEEALALDLPDLGISALEVKAEENGERLIQIALYNANEAKIAESEHERIVKLGLYTDSECTEPVDAKYLTKVQARNGADAAIQEITDETELELVDDGMFTVQYRFDVASFIKEADPENDSFRTDGEIRDNGLQLYAKVWAEDADGSESETVDEFITSNNMRSVKIESLIEKTGGELVSIDTALRNFLEEEETSGSEVTVNIQNNSIQEETSGNVIVTLLDANGQVIEAQQLYQKNKPNENFGLLSMKGEEKRELTFTFKKPGAAVKAYYSNDVLDTDAKVSQITLENTGLNLESFEEYPGNENIRVANVDTWDLNGGQLTVQGTALEGAIQVDGATQLENDQMDIGWYLGNVTLRPGKVSQVVIQTIETDEQTGESKPITYIINIINRAGEETSSAEEGGNAA